MTKQTHFGFQNVTETEKTRRVAQVFTDVAKHYDVMNDLMSVGLHRVWKAFTVLQMAIKPGYRVLDVAGGTGDLSLAIAPKVGSAGQVWLTDINEDMLTKGRDRLLNEGYLVPSVVCDAENLPFENDYFDRVVVSFGLRNMTHKEKALQEMYRVLKTNGKLFILEFSAVWQPLEKLYDIYSFTVLPWLGKKIAKSEESYRYLAESIRRHPNQETLKKMLDDVGFYKTNYFNLTAGIVALHIGVK